MVQETNLLPDAGKDVLRKLAHAIDLARIVRSDSMRNRRPLTTVGGHINNLEGLLRELERDLKEQRMKSFQAWCEDQGRRWAGAATYEEFEKNAKDYEAYRKAEANRKEIENEQRRMPKPSLG